MQIITKLREAEIRCASTRKNSRAQACIALEISEQTYYRWRREYVGRDTLNLSTGR
jgi:transposase-like protein